MIKELHSIKNLKASELIKNNDTYTILRNGYNLGSFIFKNNNYYYTDHDHSMYNCDYNEINLNTNDISKAIELMNY